MAGSLTSQTIEITVGTIDIVKQTQSSWVNVGSVVLGTVGTAGTEFATLGADINYANQLVLVPRGDQYDNGVVWNEPQMVYRYGSEGVWDTVGGRSLCVIGTGTGYFGFHAGKGTTYQIVVLESEDGIAWGTGYQAVAFNQEGSWDDEEVRAPCVVVDGGTTWKMWMEAQDSTGTQRIMYATSADGLSWTVPAQCMNLGSAGALDDKGVESPSVIRDGAGFKMLYSGRWGSVTNRENICFATSEDGITWTDRQMVIDRGTLPLDLYPGSSSGRNYSMLATDGTIYKVWYSSGSNAQLSLIHATSADCINWSDPIISYRPDRNGGYNGVKEAWLLEESNVWKLWYGAHEGGTVWYATSAGTPENQIFLYDIWNGTVLTTIGTQITFRPAKDAPFVGPAYYFDNFGPTVKIGVINNATETELANVYVDVYAR